MPHIRIEYPPALAQIVDLDAFCEHMRKAMADIPAFPVAGIRIRAYAADATATADGRAFLFAHLEVIIGRGRDDATRAGIVETLYAAAEGFLKPLIGDRPFALSLEIRETTAFSEKRWNTYREALADA